jgi:hypothetical protein
VDVVATIVPLFDRHPLVQEICLVGSRARGSATDLSDWDFRLESDDLDQLVAELPALTKPLNPLAAQWDPLAHRAVFMLILEDASKVDLFPGDLTHTVEDPWQPDAANLSDIDAHFWDWAVWLAGKTVADRRDLVRTELDKLFDNLLAPLGAADRPDNIAAAVLDYVALRDKQEQVHRVEIDRRLEDAVLARLRAHQLI